MIINCGASLTGVLVLLAQEGLRYQIRFIWTGLSRGQPKLYLQVLGQNLFLCEKILLITEEYDWSGIFKLFIDKELED